MMVQVFAHVRCCSLGDEGLNNIGQVLEHTEKNDCCQIDHTISE